jgi:hypothetical protein
MTLKDLTDIMRRYGQVASPDRDCDAWRDYLQDCRAVYLSAAPWDESMEISEGFARHWIRVAAGASNVYDYETGARR